MTRARVGPLAGWSRPAAGPATASTRAPLASALGSPRRPVPALASGVTSRSSCRRVRAIGCAARVRRRPRARVGGIARSGLRRRPSRPSIRATAAAGPTTPLSYEIRGRGPSISRATRPCSTGWPTCRADGPRADPGLGLGPDARSRTALDPWGPRRSVIRPRAAVPIHWGTYWPHALGRVFAGAPCRAAGGLRRVRLRTGSRRADASDGGRRCGGMGAMSDDLTAVRCPPVVAPTASAARLDLRRSPTGLIGRGRGGLIGLGGLFCVNGRIDAAGDRCRGDDLRARHDAGPDRHGPPRRLHDRRRASPPPSTGPRGSRRGEDDHRSPAAPGALENLLRA